MDERLKEIIFNYVADFKQKKHLNCVLQEKQLITEKYKNYSKTYQVVTKPLPIIWFGNLDAYKDSTKKILTVSLNPSFREFTEKRFDSILLDQTENSANVLKNTLNKYFQTNPFWEYFHQYEWLAHIFHSDYCGKMTNTAIHIDAHSAIATYPNWGGLSTNEKLELSNKELFRNIFDYLNPNITFISVASEDFKNAIHLFPWHKNGWEYVNGRNLAKGIYINLYKQGTKLLFHGRNFKGTPFGGAPHSAYENAVKELLDEI